MKKVLIKDIVIPAGTVFSDAPQNVAMSSDFVGTTIGLTKNTCGSLYYPVTGDDKEILKEWFADQED